MVSPSQSGWLCEISISSQFGEKTVTTFVVAVGQPFASYRSETPPLSKAFPDIEPFPKMYASFSKVESQSKMIQSSTT